MHAKKSLRNRFSCMPTRPVAGEALSRHLSKSHTPCEKQALAMKQRRNTPAYLCALGRIPRSELLRLVLDSSARSLH